MIEARRLVHVPWVLALVTGCGSGAEAPAQPVRCARVTITDLTVGLTKADGSPWDGPAGSVRAEDVSALMLALGATDPVAAVAAALTRPTVLAIEKPDVKGQASLFVGGTLVGTRRFRGQADALHPIFSPPPTWTHVPLDESPRIEVVAMDEDLVSDDPIAPFAINAQVLADAARAGVVRQVEVAKQTRNDVLFVGISVIPE